MSMDVYLWVHHRWRPIINIRATFRSDLKITALPEALPHIQTNVLLWPKITALPHIIKYGST